MSRNTTRIQRLTRVTTLADDAIIPIGPASGDRAKGISFDDFRTILTTDNNITRVAVDHTAKLTDGMILANAVSGSITIFLPAASTAFRKEFTIKKIDSTSNVVTLDPDGSETIDGSATISTTVQNTSFTIKCDGVEWWIK